MKKFCQKSLLFLILIFPLFLYTQTQLSHSKLRGIQVGYPGVYFYKESKIFKELYIRNEFGIERYFNNQESDCNHRNKPFEPIVSFVPKWYYNMSKRDENSKNVSDLAYNYFSLNAKATINPNMLTGTQYVNSFNQLSIIPTWGIRRNINKYFNYEFSLGYGYFISETYSLICVHSSDSGFNLDIQVRVGFKF